MTKELYKVHRPKSFKQLAGQPAAVRMLMDFLKRDALPHALLLTGPSGVGKTTAARILKEKMGCGKSDYVEINVAESRGIDTVREIDGTMRLSPFQGKCRMWVMDECHKWSSDAMNTMLKLLEDPPPHAYFVLCTTDPGKLIKTIHTRCTEVKFSALDSEAMEVMLRAVAEKEGMELDNDLVEKIVEVADGSARKALVLLDQVRGIDDHDARLEAIEKGDSKRASIDLCRALIDPRGKWETVREIIKGLDEEPETLRRMVLGYAGSVVLGGGKLAARAYMVLCAFETDWFQSGKAGLIRASWEVFSHKG